MCLRWAHYFLKLPLLRNDYLKVYFTRGNILRNQPQYVQISYMIMFKLSPYPHCVLSKIMHVAKNKRQRTAATKNGTQDT